jgi:hypothetical protein
MKRDANVVSVVGVKKGKSLALATAALIAVCFGVGAKKKCWI